MTKVYNRKTKQLEEVKHFGGSILNKIYKHKTIANIITSKHISKLISKIYGFYDKSRISKYKINKFIKDNNIDMSLYEDIDYKNFNEFFIRKYKKINFNKKDFISPCDGKLLVYKISDNLKVKVKNNIYTVQELLNRNDDDFKDSYMFIYRLSVDNCHRFYYIDDGKRIDRVRVNGKLHTVSSSSDEYKIYKENEREYSVLDTKNFGKIIYMEVGALLIGKIINYDKEKFTRGEEKGYFLPGGSTIIIIAKDIKVDEDILKYSNKNIETIVNIGEKVGEKKC